MSSHVVTLRNAILEARAALIGATALTDLVPERSITFGNSPQKDRMPRIVIEVSGAEYDATFTQSRKVQTFTVEYAVYSKSVDTCTAIMDEVRDALDTYQSSAFAVRVTDESFQAEVDNVLLGVVVATFQDAAGIPGFDTSAAATLAAVQDDLDEVQAELALWEAEFGTDIATYQATPARIAYPSLAHADIAGDTTVEWGPNSYSGQLAAGLYNVTQPSKILHLPEIDRAADPERNKFLLYNNEFGNKHRFTYDDGTEATEVASNNFDVMTGNNPTATTGPNGDGYTGSNPQYVIDHLTGLGFWRPTLSVTANDVDSTNWHDARGMYDVFSDMQDFVDRPSTLTLAGYSDWRRMTWAEFTYALNNMDNSNWLVNNPVNNTRDVYFPPINAYLRGYGGTMLLAGPISNNANSNDDSEAPSWNQLSAQSNGAYFRLETLTAFEGRITAANNTTYSPGTLLCRRHYTNS